jgi:uncharacterized protein (UPF0335 family)
VGWQRLFAAANFCPSEIKQQLENQVSEIDRRIAELMTLRYEISDVLKDVLPPQGQKQERFVQFYRTVILVVLQNPTC